MTMHRFARLRFVLMRCAAWLAMLVFIFQLSDYLIDARKRATRSPTCQWNTVPDAGSASYSARWCMLTKDTALIQLYDADGRRLIADRTYFQLGTPNVGWAHDRIWYDTYPEDAYIALPPSLLDRLRAKLP